ncbi:hypothetical protein F511_11823 [Dorcoceras hygrometricum]|uniref:Uncharacterized protein n=1 Tax=Dorcoceras hygrometricum TaxID=472368 RepID=A0A2Z7D6L2_9LAMI|nr:hypothetical protein F511_11823 [Dorcoceras hygrometricum]
MHLLVLRKDHPAGRLYQHTPSADFFANTKRCRSNLFERHRFVIFKMHLLIFAFALLLDLHLRNNQPADLSHPADDDVTADVIIYTLALLLNILHLLIEMTSLMTSSTLNHLLNLQDDVASSFALFFIC